MEVPTDALLALTLSTPPTHPMVTVPVLDSQSYPHIANLIRDHFVHILVESDPYSCLKLQAVCRAWQNKIKCHIFHHVVLTTVDGKAYTVSTLPKSVVIKEEYTGKFDELSRNMSKWLFFARVLDVNVSLEPKVLHFMALIVDNEEDRLRLVRFREITSAPNPGPGCIFREDIPIVIRTTGSKISRNQLINQLICHENPPVDRNLLVWVWHQADPIKGNSPATGLFRYRLNPAKLVMMYFPTPGTEREAMEEHKLNLVMITVVLRCWTEIVAVIDLGPDDYQPIIEFTYETTVSYASQSRPFGDKTLKFMTHKAYRDEIGEEAYELYSMA